MNQRRMHGVITPLVTPFDAEGNVQFSRFPEIIDFLIAHGVHGLYVNGTTAEMHSLSLEERKDIAEYILEYTNGRIPVFIQVGTNSYNDTLYLAKHALEHHADGIGVVTPYYMRLSDEALIRYYVKLSHALPDDFLIYLYSIPQCAGNDLTPNVVNSILSETKNIVGIKYSLANMVTLQQYTLCGNGDFDVIVGAERLYLAGLTVGCKGIISASSQVDPHAFTKCYEAYRNGDYSSAIEASNRTHALLNAIWDGREISCFKVGMEANGIKEMHVRSPLADLSQEEREVLLTNVRKYFNNRDNM